MRKVSIIVPVYNSEKYLSKCLDSLVNQTLEDIEIIVIDDKSQDKSKEIINEYYAKQIKKIVPIFFEKNKGQGYARNVGIDRANGEYIIFVDSDDYVDLEMCEILYNKAKEKNFDIVCFDINKIINGNLKKQALQYDKSIEGDIDLKKRFKIFKSSGYFTTRMYRRKMLIDNNIKFPIGIHYEDSMFNTLTLLYANTIAKVDKGMYFYLIRDNSSSNSYNQERLYDRIETTELMFKEVNERNLYKKYKALVDYKYINMTVGNIHLCLDMFKKININKLVYIKNNLNKNIKNIYCLDEYKNLDLVSKIYLKLNMISPRTLIVLDKCYKGIIKINKRV